ncbi:DNA polymerase alpha subunit B N-terminal-domain-containing protein [Protomyces lactucae-debilis]|uniref:DNA polymerase alpha subunit B n=1 Tax=Protomyces lactucae-debilis TaxID=2754530 RepID=A0A1Y2EU26_PROLT|nr:DNA polymerase alpha subunit B N-terminal-domain-containing protein [Protomyces lactucae-debilis]ORY75073.1 DNA polymerase alpha subunit B N-terminal-domain-containing protein [Protomyces lactucae-debilis]
MDRFGELAIDVRSLLESAVKVYSISEEELFFKWEAWCFKMGTNPELNLDNATLFKQDIQHQLENSNQTRLKASVAATPASNKKASLAGYEDFLGGDVTPQSKRVKRESFKRASLTTPARPTGSALASSPLAANQTPHQLGTPVAFRDREDAGVIITSLNPTNMDAPLPSTSTPSLTANFDPRKYSFRPMYQKLSEVSEILDDQIDSFAELVLEKLGLDDEHLGDPAQQKQTDVLVVGRIVCDALNGGRLNAASVMLETSRRLGIGSRTKLDLSAVESYALFPGQLVACRGINGTGTFKVSEWVTPVALPPAASAPSEFRKETMSIVIACGPYTTQANLEFEALHALREVIMADKPDQVILLGPFIDRQHPLISSGDFDCPGGSLDGLFKDLIAPVIQDFPGLLVVPHIADINSRHPVFPQEALQRSMTGLPKGTKLLPNPALFSLDEVSFGIASPDIIKHMTTSEVVKNPAERNGITRQAAHIIQQRRFYPLFPPQISLDAGFLGLAEFGNRVPDVLILPSELSSFAKVVENVMVINPGTLSRRAGPGSFARLSIQPKQVKSTQETDLYSDAMKPEPLDDLVQHELWARSRVDIIKI